MKQFYDIEVTQVGRGDLFGDYSGSSVSDEVGRTLTDSCFAIYSKEDYNHYESIISSPHPDCPSEPRADGVP